MDEIQDKVLAKVRKLLVRAEDVRGSSENEREMAMRQAHALLAKHNLTMAQAEADGKGQKVKREKGDFELRPLAWARWISNGIAQLFFCNFFTVKMYNGKERHTFIGRPENVITACEMAKYVIDSVLRERDRRAKVEGAHDPNPWKLAFAQGAAMTIYNRCLAMKEEAETKDVVVQEKVEGAGFMLPEKREPGTALVLASHYKKEEEANGEFVEKELGIKLKTKKAVHRDNRGTGDAYSAGRSYGKDVQLNRQLGGPRKQLKGGA
jgi:hypothetical protein